MAELVEVRQGAYYDSVSLMQVSRAVQESAGVRIALVAMATELNLGLLAGMGLPCPADAGPNDLLVAVRADDDGSLTASLHALDGALLDLAARGASADGLGAAGPARTVGSAAGRLEATVALVSVPGRHAFPEAVDALDAGLSVVLFSDNVPVEQEVRLKQMAAERDLLVLGPDCGTAVIGGVGLGFANVIRSGRVGLVAASGTGAQQLMCLLDAAGVGIGCCLGVGGRDLSSAVGGRSTRQALAALDADEGTDLIVVVSKPPAPEVSATISAYAAALSTPVQFALLGAGQPDLTTAAEVAIRTVGGTVPVWPTWGRPLEVRPPHEGQPRDREPRNGALRGLFSGGTLCEEAMLLASAALGPIASNIPLQPQWALPEDLRAEGHLMIDFGDDRLTLGRPHPMIDSSLRLERLAEEASDPHTAVVLLDVVLGHGAHPDPAAEFAPPIGAAVAGGNLAVVVSLCGAAGDPQGLDRQAVALRDAGATVFLSNAAAARHAVALVPTEASP